MLAAFFDGREEGDRLTLAQLNEALQCWLEMTEAGGFDEPVPLAVLREAWLGQIDQPTLNHQFVSGGITFCTLMPMRAVPFRVVCLLGMNDGDFPRRSPQADFDLLALPGMSRPGDRSRRDDDRYLMLEALLAARDKLYLSWVGRNVRDNSEQPPSVLVSQLRDYLRDGWAMDLAGITTEHALQPFSRRYFEQGGLLTYAREWRSAHGNDGRTGSAEALPPYDLEPDFRLKLSELASFLKQPARYFFRRRLGVMFNAAEVIGEDEEPFSLDALERYFLEDSLLDDSGKAEQPDEVRQTLDARAERLAREGLLPIGLVGRRWQQQLVEGLVPVRSAWLALGARFRDAAPKLAVSLDLNGVLLEDWIDRLRTDGRQTAWLMQVSSKVLDKKGAPRGEKLIDAWLRQLAAGAVGTGGEIRGYLVARDAVVTMAPIEREEALGVLAYIAGLWRRNLDAPLPVACRTALAQLAGRDAREVYDGDGHEVKGEVEREPCLARLWPEFSSLAADGSWIELAEALYGGLAHWMAEQIEVTPHAGADAGAHPGEAA